jgi:hypothetical protein
MGATGCADAIGAVTDIEPKPSPPTIMAAATILIGFMRVSCLATWRRGVSTRFDAQTFTVHSLTPS